MCYLHRLVVSLAFIVFSTSSLHLQMSGTISNRACFGAGCFWGTEQYLRVNFGEKIKPGSIKSGAVGFMSTTKSSDNARLSLNDVCTASSGFVEVFDFEFDGTEKTYEELVKHFYMFHGMCDRNLYFSFSRIV